MPRIARACDACRTRKVRCDGNNPCAQCSHFDVQCIVSPPEKRKNPIRGRLVAKVRGETTEFARWADAKETGNAGSPAAPASASSVTTITATVAAPGPVTAEQSPSPYSYAQAATASPASSTGSYTPDFFTGLLPRFELLVLPVNPIITVDEIRASIAAMSTSSEDSALVWSFASVTLFLARASETMGDSEAHRVDDLLHRGLEDYRQAELEVAAAVAGGGGGLPGGRGGGGEEGQHPVSVKRIVTCLFLEISLMAFRRFERSFVILREAIAMLQILRVRGWRADGEREMARLQRIYWEAYIHERFLTIASGYPSILPPLESGLPLPDSTQRPHVELGFNRLICLFQVLDWPFLAYWQEQQFLLPNGDTRSDITPQWIEGKQAELDRDEEDAAEAERQLRVAGRGTLTEFQHVDLFVTRLWLRTILWQLALSNGLLHSSSSAPAGESTGAAAAAASPSSPSYGSVAAAAAHDTLSLDFPARQLAVQLQKLVSWLGSVTCISTQGSGMVQKLFEITSTVADVLAALVAASDGGDGDTAKEMEARVADFVVLVGWLSQFERVRREQRDYLNDKLRSLTQRYPGIRVT